MTGKGGMMMMMMVPVSVTRDIRQIADDILAGYDPKKRGGAHQGDRYPSRCDQEHEHPGLVIAGR